MTTEYFPIAAGGRRARLIVSNAAPMPAEGVVETAQRLAARLQHLVPAAVYAELCRLLIADAVHARSGELMLIAETEADPIDQAAALLWEANYPDLPAWHELEEDVCAEYRAFLGHCLGQHQVTVGQEDWLMRRHRDDNGGTSRVTNNDAPAMVDTILTDDASALQAARTLLDQVPALGLMVSLLDDDPAVVYELAKGGPYVPLSAGALRLVIVMSAGDQPLIHAHVDTWSIRTATDPAHPAKRLTLTVWGFAARQDPTRIELPDVEAIRAVPTPLSALLRPGGNTGPIT